MNRVLLSLTGLVLVAAGAFAVLTNLGVLSFVDRSGSRVAGTGRPATWVWYVVAAAGVVVALLALRWLLSQVTPAVRSQTWQVSDEPDGRTELSSDDAAAPFVADVSAFPGVHSARAALSGPLSAPRLAVMVGIEQDASVDDVRSHIGEYALPRLRQALDLDELPAAVEFRFTAKAGTRVQ